MSIEVSASCRLGAVRAEWAPRLYVYRRIFSRCIAEQCGVRARAATASQSWPDPSITRLVREALCRYFLVVLVGELGRPFLLPPFSLLVCLFAFWGFQLNRLVLNLCWASTMSSLGYEFFSIVFFLIGGRGSSQDPRLHCSNAA